METLLPLMGALDPWMLMTVILGYFAYKAWTKFLDDDNDIQGQ